ncbi:DUF4148 domain-containing protein [Trinickia terrae]|uniref:DUF4148 domain-containing protein n=1 Tax=Trinickia terrae TaxID=2571161 RepID=A0A4U1I252_9BURK|nr:DUF4148 domain-containing protein [Trinickia terrae]TKC87263.1 DUF4148 domain-containing protein [Trinickia terrae]
MNKRLVVALSMALLASAGFAVNASAQEKTRAEVRQELIQAENNGLRLVTDTSYPEVNPIFAKQAAQQASRTEQDTSGTGAAMSASSAAGKPMTKSHGDSCVGPVSYCTVYFGS